MADVAVNTLPTESSPAAADTVLTVKNADGSLVRVALSAIKSLFGVPSASSSTPADLGTAAAGSSGDFARADHVHNKPTYSASDVGAVAVAQGVGHSGEFLVVGSDGNVTTVTLATWQGGSY